MRLSKRRFLGGLGATGLASAGWGFRIADAAPASDKPYDIIVVGAGTAGLPTAIFASQRGARVLLIEAAPAIGGTLFLSSAQMSAAGTKLQKSKGIVDSPQAHFDDVMRIGGGTADPAMLRLFVENAAATVDWLGDNGFEPLPNHPVTGGGHEAYETARYFWAKDGGMAVLAVLDKVLQAEMARGNITLLLDTEVKGLVQQGADAPVTGVVAGGKDAKPVKYLGASGGADLRRIRLELRTFQTL